MFTTDGVMPVGGPQTVLDVLDLLDVLGTVNGDRSGFRPSAKEPGGLEGVVGQDELGTGPPDRRQ